ncbi:MULTISPECIES: HlyD family type I secretion periplasmic adaptor subunit [Donghicola]|jgi:adhesin transport system membrane fusion protein|uniref:HlyD family type I secretion periplasmic adaptor subunit n=1 Tax=Donghicola sp. TaxID=1929294 RepID=UPI0025D24365|nr:MULTISPECIES: HlyD family type I secretion periplasmic adaptor subunit [Donghicola]MCI5039294.1 HlyD family type I secretion periplasmic adaptor subunit [Donghicola eburneus]MCT4576129.1 HlyD family type I secretion periplasmic adaptor subunit [Donghicola sp.]
MTTLSTEFEGRTRGPSRIIWMTGAVLIAFIVWAALAPLDVIVRGQGEMISSSRPQIIQNLEGGILAELYVKEGDQVDRGQMLARLHGTQFKSEVDDIAAQVTALEIRRARLEAELAGEFSFEVPAAMQEAAPEIVASERKLLEARQSDYVKSRDGAQQVLNQASEEQALLEKLLERKIVALIEVTRARKATADAQKRYDEIVTQTDLQRAESYSETLKELNTLKQNLKASRDQLDRTTLISPMRGVVNNLAVTTIGGVVRSGEEIMQIIPMDDELFVEAKIKPKDIAQVRPGQKATIKLSSYDYTIYGALNGEVELVSADTFKDERSSAPDGDPHYKVTVRVDLSNLTERQREIEMRPGMLATVELYTGEKTVLQYLLKPLYKSQEALREP